MKTNSDHIIAQQILATEQLGGRTVLEIGCGDGRITSLLVESSCHLTAIDVDKRLLTKAANRVKGVKFILASGEKTNFPDNLFDVVIFTLSLHHQDSVQALSEAKRILKQDGKIIVVEPNEDGEVEKLFALLVNENQEKRAAQKAIMNCGLELSQQEQFLAKWTFDNLEDLQQSIFAYYEMEYDPEIAQKLVALIGDKENSSPIIIEDKMTIQILK
ncbi:MAG: class I SAM-dependent methyltransferase [Pelovirga sp.]